MHTIQREIPCNYGRSMNGLSGYKMASVLLFYYEDMDQTSLVHVHEIRRMKY